jgi:hypothetical protein
MAGTFSLKCHVFVNTCHKRTFHARCEDVITEVTEECCENDGNPFTQFEEFIAPFILFDFSTASLISLSVIPTSCKPKFLQRTLAVFAPPTWLQARK